MDLVLIRGRTRTLLLNRATFVAADPQPVFVDGRQEEWTHVHVLKNGWSIDLSFEDFCAQFAGYGELGDPRGHSQ